jgi:uncharacterized protein CbrC (UPF0167 family)
MQTSVTATGVDRIFRGNASLYVSHERDYNYASSPSLNSTLSGVGEASLAHRSKRERVSRDQQLADDFRSDPATKPQYRSYQQDQWEKHYQELLNFNERHGHCNVPHTYDANLSLARWAKRQRYQYTRKLEQKQSCLSDARQQKLDAVGFAWDLQTMAWQERFDELVKFKQKNGHCNVPSRFRENPALGMWAKTQRQQYNFYLSNPFSSRLTPERFELLTNLGFSRRDEPLAGKRNKKTRGVVQG